MISDEVKSKPIMKNLSSHSGEYFILMHSSQDLIHAAYSWSNGLLIHMDKNYTSSINVVLEMFVTHFKNCVILAMGLGDL